MGSRRRAREIALQILFSFDQQEELSAGQVIDRFFAHFTAGDDDEGLRLDDDERLFAVELVSGVAAQRADIDGVIQSASRNWRLERMAQVDRNLLRLAVYELRFAKGEPVPAKAVINEAIEIAKRFGTAESPAFINGILDRCMPEK